MFPRPLASLCLGLGLTACAAQTVLVENTRSFVESGRAAGDRAAAFFRAAGEAQLEANALLVASDPSCRWGVQLVLRTDFTTGSSLCLNGAPPGVGSPYSLRPISAEAGAPAAALIAAMGAYLGELAKLDNASVPEFKQAVDDVMARLTKLQGVIAGIGKARPAVAGAAAGLNTAERKFAAPVDAAANLLDFFAGLAKVDNQAGKIRAYVIEHGAAFESGVDALAQTMEIWRIGVVGTSDQVAELALINGTNSELAGTLDFDRRRAVLTRLLVALQERREADAGFDATIALLSDLKAQHAALRAFAAGHPSAADRVRIAHETQDEAWDFLGRVGDLASAVAGVI